MKLTELSPRTVNLGIRTGSPKIPRELAEPAKTQGELMSYRLGYRTGLACGKRTASELLTAAIAVQEYLVSVSRPSPSLDAAIKKAKL